ncbi:MAG: amidohydrolase [Proteobacteria bacterium]|nr:amidohydrolase [Pseudomonadota bacterium]
MHRRRALILAAGAVGLALAGTALAQAPTDSAADLVLVNGDVRTADPAMGRATAFAVRAGRFVKIGSDADVRNLVGPGTQVVDGAGRTVVPGMIDGHTHLAMGSDLVAGVDLSYIPDKKTWLRKIKERSDQLPPGEWLVGGGWDYTLGEGVLPTKEDIDSVVPDRPVFLQDIDAHSHWANSLALKMAGITARTPVPPGSEIVVDPKTGEPTGILKESGAAELILRQPGLRKTEQRKLDGLRQTIAYANSLGVTGVHDMADRENLFDYLKLAEKGELNIRIWYGQFTDNPKLIPQAVRDRADVDRKLDRLPTARTQGPTLKFGYIKSIVDGVLSTRTAVLEKPYSDTPGWKGELFRSQADLESLIMAANGAGFPVSVHAIGDAAVNVTLNAYANVRKPLAGGLQNRIEHIEVIDPDDVMRFARLGVVASMQPNHATGTIGKYITERIGAEREHWAYVWQKMIANRVPLVFGSDWPTSPMSPLTQINDAVFRESPFGLGNGPWHAENAVTFDQALFAYTQAGANMTPWAKEIGSITVGKWADFVVLDGTLPAPLDRSVRQRHVQSTYLAGKRVFEKQ